MGTLLRNNLLLCTVLLAGCAGAPVKRLAVVPTPKYYTKGYIDPAGKYSAERRITHICRIGGSVSDCSKSSANTSAFQKGSSAPPPGAAANVNPADGGLDEPLANLCLTKNSLAPGWQLYYDSLKNTVRQTAGWSIEEQADKSLILTDNQGNEVLFVPIGDPSQPAGGGGCNQYEYIPGYNADVSYDPETGVYTVAAKDGNNIQLKKHGTKYQPDLVKDTNDTTLAYAYDGAGRLTTITDIHGRTMSFAYDALNRLNRVADFTGRQISWTYDGYNHVDKLTDIDGSVNTYGYEPGPGGRLSAINYASVFESRNCTAEN